MKEPRRLAEDHPVAAALIGAARDHRASDTLRRRTLQIVSVVPATAGAAVAAAVTTTSSAVKLWIAASAIAAAGVAGGGAWLYGSHASESHTKILPAERAHQIRPQASLAIAEHASAIAAASGSAVGMQGETAPTAAIGAAPTAAQRRPSGHERRAPAPATTAAPPVVVPRFVAAPELAGELRLLDAANRALRGQAPARALAALDEYQRIFPAGALADEALVLRVTALVKTGARDQGAALAARFLRQHPNSMLTDRLRAALSSAETDATGKETTR
jgi:hypothetical protein